MLTDCSVSGKFDAEKWKQDSLGEYVGVRTPVKENREKYYFLLVWIVIQWTEIKVWGFGNVPILATGLGAVGKDPLFCDL